MSGNDPSQSFATLNQDVISSQITGDATPISGRNGVASMSSVPTVKSPVVVEYENMLANHLQPFISASNDIGDVLVQQAENVAELAQQCFSMIDIAAKTKKPDTASNEFGQLLKPLQNSIAAAIQLREENRSSKLFNHLSVVSEGIPAVGWVAVDNTPVSYISDMRDAAQFYANRVIKEFKETDKRHVEWTQLFNNFLKNLQEYVKKHHTTGLAWNADGASLSQMLNSDQDAKASAPAPPPPPPPPSPPLITTKNQSDSSHNMNAVFAQINQGQDITAGLKKVEKGQKNAPSTRPVNAGSTRTNPGSESLSLSKRSKPSQKVLDGNKWLVVWHAYANTFNSAGIFQQ